MFFTLQIFLAANKATYYDDEDHSASQPPRPHTHNFNFICWENVHLFLITSIFLDRIITSAACKFYSMHQDKSSWSHEKNYSMWKYQMKWNWKYVDFQRVIQLKIKSWKKLQYVEMSDEVKLKICCFSKDNTIKDKFILDLSFNAIHKPMQNGPCLPVSCSC
jgi:hypothetical protein